MPQRSNDFQRLIYLIKHNLAGDSFATESAMLTDMISNEKVEVDVCVEGNVAGERINVCVECRDRSRKADRNWVLEMKAKHDRLPTNMLILATSKGFSKGALQVARDYGIKTLTLEETEDLAFPEKLASEMALWVHTVSVRAEKVVFEVELDEGVVERVIVSPDQYIFDSDGATHITAIELVHPLLHAKPVQDYLLDNGKPDHVWFDLTWSTDDTPPMYLQRLKTKELRRIKSVYIKGPFSYTVNGLKLRRAKLGQVHVAWGKTVVLERDAMVVVTRDEHGIETFSLNLAKEEPRVSREVEGSSFAGGSTSRQ